MRKTLMLLMMGMGLAAGTVALADDDCDRPMRDWQPREAAAQKARDMGVEVRRIRTDDGCYKVYGRAADGRSVEIEIDPATLDVLEMEYRNRNGGRHGDREGNGRDHDNRDRRDRYEHGAGVAPQPGPAPQANPLIGPATGRTN